MAQIIGIDPGNEATALVVLDSMGRPTSAVKMANDDMWGHLITTIEAVEDEAPVVVIEEVRSYGMPVGAEVFATVRWAGRFEQMALDHECEVVRIGRLDVKTHLCHSAKARDSNIRQALVDRWGGKDAAIGVKSAPGPLYGYKADLWAALAVAVTHYDLTAPPPNTAARRRAAARREPATPEVVTSASRARSTRYVSGGATPSPRVVSVPDAIAGLRRQGTVSGVVNFGEDVSVTIGGPIQGITNAPIRPATRRVTRLRSNHTRLDDAHVLDTDNGQILNNDLTPATDAHGNLMFRVSAPVAPSEFPPIDF